MASASKKAYTTEEVSQKIFENDDEDFPSDIDSENSKKMKKIKNHVIGSPSFLSMKKIPTLM